MNNSPSLQTQLLSVEDIRQIVSNVGLDALMDEAIARLSQAFSHFDPTQTIVPVRTGFNYEQPYMGLIEWMPLFEQQQQQIVVKAVGYHPQNPRVHQLPTVLSTVSAYDPSSGHLTAVIDGTFLTALRTGAASAIASRCIALPESKVLGLIGAGAQAVTQLHALSRCFELEQVLVFDQDPVVSASFAARVACLKLDHLDIRVVSCNELVAEADILCTATSVEVGQGPVFEAQDCKSWLHVNGIGADFPGKFEVPLSFLEQSLVCPDFREQALVEGECQRLETGQYCPELTEVVQQPERYRGYQQQWTVFDSTGFALEDQVVMNLLLDHAARLKLGSWVSLESASADAQNPYDFCTDVVQPMPRLERSQTDPAEVQPPPLTC